MIAIADDSKLHLLQFADGKDVKKMIGRLLERKKSYLVLGQSPPLDQIERELDLYFSGSLTSFRVPLLHEGSPFQQQAWQILKQIPYGQTISYLEQACLMGNPKACRPVARANSVNPFVIVVPCHRVINHNGDLGGYSGSKPRKEWLIQHEKEKTPKLT